MIDGQEPDKETAENGDGRDQSGQFAEGNSGGPGRPKGKPNKVNAVLKDDILTAYQERGGIAWLRGLKDRDFVALLQKVMPKEIAADVRMQAGGGQDIDFSSLPDDELARLAGILAVSSDDFTSQTTADLRTWAGWIAAELARREAPALPGGSDGGGDVAGAI